MPYREEHYPLLMELELVGELYRKVEDAPSRWYTTLQERLGGMTQVLGCRVELTLADFGSHRGAAELCARLHNIFPQILHEVKELLARQRRFVRGDQATNGLCVVCSRRLFEHHRDDPALPLCDPPIRFIRDEE